MDRTGRQVKFVADFKANLAIRESLPLSTLYRKLFPFCKFF